MDIRALAELVMMALMGLSVLTIAIGFSVRMFLAPTMRELIARKYPVADQTQSPVGARIDNIEDDPGVAMRHKSGGGPRQGQANVFDYF